MTFSDTSGTPSDMGLVTRQMAQRVLPVSERSDRF